MKSLFGFLLLFTSFYVSQGQQTKVLQFREEIHDFGSVAEDKGPVTYEFVFTNTGSRPVKILNVQASCGCTTPGWSKEPIAPGKNGFIQASYNPKGRPGYFNKSLTVTTDLEASPLILQIKGNVTSEGMHDEKSEFTFSNGSLKLKVSAFNMGKVFLRDEFAMKEFPFINGGDKPLVFTGKGVSPAHIKLEIQPTTVAPGARGVLKVSYNGKIKNQYGFQSDNVELHTNDDINPVKPFSVYATIEDYFPQLSAEDMQKAPQMKLAYTSLEFGRVGEGGSIDREIAFTNTGRKQLDIKAVQGNCTCVTASAAKTSLKPGESSVIKVSFNSQDRKGTQQKAVTIYTNDPRNPVQRFTFTAYVD
ncbi:DUF1573 domain-containing protein [Chryseosolibacter indicus]|uniref:DUF1573 domain-containing protein n=1 Tax=Chryseosolibacter indicus TaxID=2782351 RepID=A0ABS5VQK5_9BACT|nr:DUF1573 domain-containing protein [Chryseosolibacter indicus]MBT1703283.1 DUF1573 domain-containing protein [Chryseosolibacter indicus]